VQREHISTHFYKAKFTTNPINNWPIISDIQSVKFKVYAGDRKILVDSFSCEDMVVMLYNGRDFEMKTINFWKENSLVLHNWRQLLKKLEK
jgi:hypothetical protein